jgi:hypothetical protein
MGASKLLSKKVRDCFQLLENDKLKCKINNCKSEFISKQVAVLKRHIIRLHKKEAKALNLLDDSGEIGNNSMKTNFIRIAMDKAKVNKLCLKLVTIHHLPFQAMEYEAITEFLEGILKSLNMSINSKNIIPKLENASDQIIKNIQNELVGRKIFSLKIDLASRFDKSVLGINVQFIKDKKLIIRTLGLMVMTERHFSNNIKTVIGEVLSKFGVSFDRIYSITIDNGANMVKTVKIISNEVSSLAINEDDIDDMEDATESYETNLVSCMRCTAHTLQLVVHDVIKLNENSERLKQLREITKLCRNVRLRHNFSENNVPLPNLDVITRWGSTYKMVSVFQKNKDFFVNLQKDFDDFHISDDLWKFVADFECAFKPIFDATKKFQENQLLMGNIIKIR